MIATLKKYLALLANTAHTDDDRKLAQAALDESAEKPFKIISCKEVKDESVRK